MNLPVVAAVGSLLYQGFNVRIREGWKNSEFFTSVPVLPHCSNGQANNSCHGRDNMAFVFALLKMMFLLYYLGVPMMVLLYKS